MNDETGLCHDWQEVKELTDQLSFPNALIHEKKTNKESEKFVIQSLHRKVG